MGSTSTASASTMLPPPRPQYPIGVPSKFSPEGLVQRFPGNTTLCHLPSNSPLLPSLRTLHATLSSHATLSKLIHLVPPASWHMTIFDGVREEEREPELWPAGKENQPLAECTSEFGDRLRQLGLQLEKEGLGPPYRMRVRGVDDCTIGIGLEIDGATTEEECRMRRLRDAIADTLGFRAPNHESYTLHITVAYLMRHVDGEDRLELNRVVAQSLQEMQREFELGAVEYCTFENMYSFPRQFYLGEGED